MLDDTDPRYHIAINSMSLTGKIPPGDARWATFNDSFRNVDRSLLDIADAIYTGHSYCHWHDGRRKLDNFIAAQYLAVDMDTDDERSTFDALLCHDLVRMYAGMIHTTPSHTAATPRARVLFFLDGLLTDTKGYEAAARFLVAQFDGADAACVDASRFFYGALNCDIWFGENVLPLAQLRRYYRRWNKHQPRPDAPANVVRMDDYRPEPERQKLEPLRDTPAALAAEVRRAANGNRNNTLNRQAFFAGKGIQRGDMTQTEAEQALLNAAMAIQLGESEARKTIRSGINAGLAKGA